MGLVAQMSRSNQRILFTPAPLTVTAVFRKLQEMAKTSGHMVSSYRLKFLISLTFNEFDKKVRILCAHSKIFAKSSLIDIASLFGKPGIRCLAISISDINEFCSAMNNKLSVVVLFSYFMGISGNEQKSGYDQITFGFMS